MAVKPSVGIDIGSSYMDCAVLATKGNVIELKDYFSVKKEVPGENKPNDNNHMIRELDKRKLISSKVAVSVTDRNFIVITINGLPKLAPKEKDIAIRNEIEQKLPFPLEECAFHAVRLNAKETNDNNYVAFCTRLSDVIRTHEIASSFNVLPESVVTEMIANMNCAIFNEYMNNQNISYLLVDVGGMHIGFTLVTSNMPWLTFSISAKDTFTAMATGTEFNPMAFFDEQIHEIQKIISSFEEKSVISPVKKVLLFGKASMTAFAYEKLCSVTPISVEVVNPLKKITVPEALKATNPEATISSVAVGLALTSLEVGAKKHA